MEKRINNQDDLLSLDVKGFRYVVMYRDHYKGNAKGEYFATADYDRIKATMPYWFRDVERPVYRVVLTKEDVPAMVAKAEHLNKMLSEIDSAISAINSPKKPDGRKTRKSAPAEYAAYDKAVAENKAKLSKAHARRAEIFAERNKLQYTGLYRIS